MRSADGRLLRTTSAGAEPKLNAYLEDYAFLIDALVSLYETTFTPRWLQAALELTDVMIDQFWDSAEAVFFTPKGPLRGHDAIREFFRELIRGILTTRHHVFDAAAVD